jgi:membrane dipeptidase
MCCCSMISRRELLQLLAMSGAMFASGCARPSAEHLAAAEELAQETLSVDLHSHAGLQPRPRLSLGQQLDKLAQGRVGACVFTVSPDRPVLGYTPGKGVYVTRSPEPGELYAYVYRALQPLVTAVESGRVALVRTAADLAAGRARGQRAAIIATEGGDFLEGRLERLHEAYDRGQRVLQLVHYRVNELGDIQTAPAVHGGLTDFGKDVVREMNRLGMLVDLAHATEADVRAAVDVSTKAMMISHTNLQNRAGWLRFISAEHARLVTTRGGIIGSMPIAVGIYGFSGYIDEIMRLVDTVGVDHVAIGTDMEGILGGNALFDDYAAWPTIPAALLARGVARDDVAKIVGGNFRRVFREVTG